VVADHPDRLSAGFAAMNALMSTARARTKTFLTGSAIVMLLLIMATAVLVGQGMANITRTQSDQQAAKAVDLLGTVGRTFQTSPRPRSRTACRRSLGSSST
jgi:hypothetical protein